MAKSSREAVRREVNDLRVEYVPIGTIKPNPNNPRVHDMRQRRNIRKSISVFGLINPILVDKDNQIVAGHLRHQGGKDVGLETVPILRVTHLTEAQTRAYMIADNRLAEQSQWDKKLLAENLKILCEADLSFGIEATGFEVGEIDLLIEGLSEADDDCSDEGEAMAQDAEAVHVTQNGDVWTLGKNRVLCGNSLNAESWLTLMDGKKATMVFTDPPFNVRISGHAGGLGAIQHKDFDMAAGEMSDAEFTDFNSRIFSKLVEHSSEGSLHFVFMDWRHISEILAASKHVYAEFKALCIWVKDNGGMGSLYRSQHELIFVFKNGKERHRNNIQLGQYGRYRTNVWKYPGANSFSRTTEEGNLLELHPTVKPVALVADAILDCSARGELVLDPFLGSGTTVIAAERTGRICFGMELDPTYVDTTVRRWQRFTGLSATHAVSGKTFDELEKEVGSESGK